MSLGIIISKINLVTDMELCYEFLIIRNYNRKAENRRNYCAQIIITSYIGYYRIKSLSLTEQILQRVLQMKIEASVLSSFISQTKK